MTHNYRSLYLVTFCLMILCGVVLPAAAQTPAPLQTPEKNAYVTDLAWSPDSSTLFVATSRCDPGYEALATIQIMDTATSAIIDTLSSAYCDVQTLDLNPAGSQLAFASAIHPEVSIWDLTNRKMLTIPYSGRGVGRVRWSPDGSLLAFTDASTGKILIYNLTTEALTPSATTGVIVDWSPDGTRLVVLAADSDVRVVRAGGEELFTLEDSGTIVMNTAWSPDGSRIVTNDSEGTIRIWDASSGGLLLALPGYERFGSSLVWSPNSRQFASASFDRTVRVWNAATGEEQAVFENDDFVLAVAWSPDGQQLACGDIGATVHIFTPPIVE